jgi:hypothetical protein
MMSPVAVTSPGTLYFDQSPQVRARAKVSPRACVAAAIAVNQRVLLYLARSKAHVALELFFTAEVRLAA